MKHHTKELEVRSYKYLIRGKGVDLQRGIYSWR